MKARQALSTAAARLARGSDTARLDAELLMAHAMGVERNALLLSRMDDAVPAAFDALLERRLAGEPIAYIVGTRDFWSVRLKVGPGVLVPRPDSETLIEAAVDHFETSGPRTVLDLGTGPGTLLLAALAQWPHATGIGVDRSDRALAFARDNADALGLAQRAEFRCGDWTQGLEGAFDLILCNPPYVETAAALPRDVAHWEPAEALFSGDDGLDDYRRLAPAIPPLIAPAGLACIEVGAGQAGDVIRLFEEQGVIAQSRKDLNGHDRCIVIRH